MNGQDCLIDDCETLRVAMRPRSLSGFHCETHKKRLARHGDAMMVRWAVDSGPASVRFWSKVNKDGPVPASRPELGPCWLWTRATSSPLPYGVFWDGERLIYAHRFAYQDQVGPIPDGLEPDHLCGVYQCVRHLELVTRRENVRREKERLRWLLTSPI